MKNFNKFLVFVLLSTLLLGACNLPTLNPESAETTGNGDGGEVTDGIVTPTLTPAAAAIQDCSPILTTTSTANVRGGPGTNYNIVGSIPLGGTAPVAGKSQDGTWWYIQFPGAPGGYGWIAGSITSAVCIPTTLASIAAPPAPAAPPVNTPKPSNNDDSEDPTEEPTDPPSLIDPGILIYLLPTATPIPIVIPTFEMPEIPCFWC